MASSGDHSTRSFPDPSPRQGARMRSMKHHAFLHVAFVALGAALAASPSSTVHAQQAAAPAATRAPAAPRERPPLFFREEWKETTETGDITVSQQFVANPNLELKLYGPGAKGQMITGSAKNPQNPTHVWNGMCAANCAMTLRDKNNFVDL